MVNQVKNRISNTRNIFWFLCIGIFTMVFFYMYFLIGTIYSVVERNQIEKSIALSEGDIASVETKYLLLKNSVTEELANSKGFKILASTRYISPKQAVKELSYNASR